MTAAFVTLLLLAPPAESPPKAPGVDTVAVSHAIGRKLRCPVCQGMPISESPSDMAQAMMRRVSELVAEGKSEPEIRDYFVARYGEWVLLDPEAHGFNILLWVLPPAALLVGLALVVRWTRKNVATPNTNPNSLDANSRDALARELDEREA